MGDIKKFKGKTRSKKIVKKSKGKTRSKKIVKKSKGKTRSKKIVKKSKGKTRSKKIVKKSKSKTRTKRGNNIDIRPYMDRAKEAFLYKFSLAYNPDIYIEFSKNFDTATSFKNIEKELIKWAKEKDKEKPSKKFYSRQIEEYIAKTLTSLEVKYDLETNKFKL